MGWVETTNQLVNQCEVCLWNAVSETMEILVTYTCNMSLNKHRAMTVDGNQKSGDESPVERYW